MEYQGSSKMIMGMVGELEEALSTEDILNSGTFGSVAIQRRGVGTVIIVIDCPTLTDAETQFFTILSDYAPLLECHAVGVDASGSPRAVTIGTDGKITAAAGGTGLQATVTYGI